MTFAHRGIAFFFASLLLAAPAAAQTEAELEQARAQFREGVDLVNEERWPEALERFRAVARVRDVPPVRYNLALALSHTEGGEAEAARILEALLRDSEADEATKERARARLAQIEPAVARLILTIRGDEGGTRVSVDGADVPLAMMGQPYRVQPGGHVVELRWGRRVRDHQDVDVAAGASVEVELDANGTYQEDQLAASIEDATHDDGDDGEITDQWWFWTAIGVGGAVILGIVIGFAASSVSEPQPVSGNLTPGILRVMP